MMRSRRHFLQTAAGLAAGFGASPRMGCAQASTDEAAKASPVHSVRYLGKQFLDNPVGVTGADGATSLVLPTGESLWVFGDTVEGPFETIRGLELTKLRSNTAAIVPKQDPSRGIHTFRFLTTADGKRPRQVIPFADEEDPSKHRVWGIHGASLGDHVYLYYHRITMLDDVDVFVNFKLDGMGIARAKADDLEFSRLAAPDGTREFWKGDVPTFGVFVEHREEFVYLWGCLATGMFLARAPHESLADLAAYEYLVEAPTADQPAIKPRWARNFAPTAMLFDAVPNEMSAAYNAHLGCYCAFHSLHRESKIALRTAPEITGPWSPPQVVYSPERVKDTDLIYAVKEHPELALDGGRVVYLTFVNSSVYAPDMIELTLA